MNNAPIEEPISLAADEPLGLVESDDTHAVSMRAFGATAGFSKTVDKFKRPLNVNGTGATRCRIFYSKIAATSLEYMQNQINEWIDSDKIEVKHVTEVVGTMEGKIAVPSIIVTIWY
ncbi:MAG: hypothetical protein GXY38_12030 [Planctomycetes bacterium]|jgi:hypothetical protein|nr:hypothetical protein [Planctomycetota bacterium]